MQFVYQVDAKLLNLSDKESEKATQDGQKAIFERFLTNLFAARYPEGVKGLTVRCLSRFFDRLDQTPRGEPMELDAKDLDLLKEVFGYDLPLHPAQVRYYTQLQKNYEETVQSSQG